MAKAKLKKCTYYGSHPQLAGQAGAARRIPSQPGWFHFKLDGSPREPFYRVMEESLVFEAAAAAAAAAASASAGDSASENSPRAD